MRSSWPQWAVRACDVKDRVATCRTTGSRLPEIECRTSFISTSPWPEVKLVTRPPASANPSQAEAALWGDSATKNSSRSSHRLRLPAENSAANASAIADEGGTGKTQAAWAICDSTQTTAWAPSEVATSPGYRGKAGSERHCCEPISAFACLASYRPRALYTDSTYRSACISGASNNPCRLGDFIRRDGIVAFASAWLSEGSQVRRIANSCREYRHHKEMAGRLMHPGRKVPRRLSAEEVSRA